MLLSSFLQLNKDFMKKDITVKYENADYRICCNSDDEECTIFKVYEVSEGKPYLRYMYGTFEKRFLTITLKTGNNQNDIKYFHDQIVKHYSITSDC